MFIEYNSAPINTRPHNASDIVQPVHHRRRKNRARLVQYGFTRGGFSFSLALNYTGPNVHFSDVAYSGSSSSTTNADYAGSMGSVTITGSLTPFSGMPFATLFFDAAGKGSFDADITTLKINGSSSTFVDPAPYGFSILGESIATQVNGSVNGTYQPLDSFFTPSYTLKSMPQHGGVVFGEAQNPSAWKYTPAPGFYGQDTFTLRVSDPSDTKEKTYSIDVSPVGTSGNDTFHSSAASYHTDGGAGLDTITYAGKVANFEITGSQASAVITDKSGAEGVNHLDNFERLMFSDSAIALDIAGNGGQAYRLYQAAFDRVPDAGGLGFWIHYMDGGMSLNEVAAQFMASLEFKTLYGDNPVNAEFIDKLYHNVLHRTGDQSGVDFWMNYLTSGGGTQAKTLAFFGESPENQAALIGTIGHGFTYTPYG